MLVCVVRNMATVERGKTDHHDDVEGKKRKEISKTQRRQELRLTLTVWERPSSVNVCKEKIAVTWMELDNNEDERGRSNVRGHFAPGVSARRVAFSSDGWESYHVDTDHMNG